MLPTIEELRQQCRIDYQDEDNLLKIYLSAALKRAENRLNRKLYENELPSNDETALLINDDIKMALMLAVCHFYDTRDASKIPQGFYELIDSYRHITI